MAVLCDAALGVTLRVSSLTGDRIVVEQVAALEACADALLEAGDREVAVQLLEKLADLPGVGE